MNAEFDWKDIDAKLTNNFALLSQLKDEMLRIKDIPGPIPGPDPASAANLVVTPQQFGAVANSATDATDAFNQAIEAASATGAICFIPSGTYIIQDTLTLPWDVRIVGSGMYRTSLKWNGAPGGVVLSTARLTSGLISTNTNFVGHLEGFSIVYPAQLLAKNSTALYVAMPSGTIQDLGVFAGQGAPVAGTQGVVFDGTANMIPFRTTVNVQGGLESGIVVGCNHIVLEAATVAYAQDGIVIKSDSLDDSSGPPYNVNIFGSHGFRNTQSFIRATNLHSAQVFGGFNESFSAATLYVDATCTGFISVNSVSTVGGARIKTFSTNTRIYFRDPQDFTSGTFIGSSNGTPEKIPEGTWIN